MKFSFESNPNGRNVATSNSGRFVRHLTTHGVTFDRLRGPNSEHNINLSKGDPGRPLIHVPCPFLVVQSDRRDPASILSFVSLGLIVCSSTAPAPNAPLAYISLHIPFSISLPV